MLIEVTKKIRGCWNQCPYFSVDEDGMYCSNPDLKANNHYERMIISWGENISHGFPKKCPLIGEVTGR
jgi:hypothetical protein